MANLYGGVRTNVNTDAAVKHFVSAGATIGKINLGIPLYGRAYENTQGLGQAYNGVCFPSSLIDAVPIDYYPDRTWYCRTGSLLLQVLTQ
jgi:GH18 family chitinase